MQSLDEPLPRSIIELQNEAELRILAQEWLRLDQDPSTRQEIQELLDKKCFKELELRLRKRIAFGTAGLRAPMKAGFSCMNSLTVIQASQGLAVYVLAQTPDAKKRGIVVGHDARHNSKHFSQLAAAVFEASGLLVLTFTTHVHTPMVPFSVKVRKAAAGVMITASHNPAQDNGYKVYWSNGCQIIPPHDSGIAKAIEENLEPRVWSTTSTSSIADDLTESYFKIIAMSPATRSHRWNLTPFMYTPMHGVGLPYMQGVAASMGYAHMMHVVEAQAQPDPDFSTVKFPNPEEPGALELALTEAEANDIGLVLANDPDADRFSAAERLEGGIWHQFTGNQLGILFASHVLDTYPERKDRASLKMLTSTVSSRMMNYMAVKEHFHCGETLTGFKWLGNSAQQSKAEGLDVTFAFEEAIGFMFSDVVWDKDGIAAAAAFLAACQRWKAQGLTPWAKLQLLYERYGYFEDANTYLISPSPDVTKAVFDSIREIQPEHVSGVNITRWRDLTARYDSLSPDNVPDLPPDPTTQMITCELQDGVRFTIRSSGTEPKVKLYVEAKADSSGAARRRAHNVRDELLNGWFKLGSGNGLKLAGT